MTSLKFYLSGGRENYSPSASLGGTRSLNILTDQKNNLFDDVPAVDALEGTQEFSCLFLVNESNSTVSNIQVRISSPTPAEDFIDLAIQDFPSYLLLPSYNSELSIENGLKQSLKLSKIKGISKLEIFKGTNLGNPTDSIQIGISDLDENFITENGNISYREFSGMEWNNLLDGEKISIWTDLELPSQKDLMILIKRTGETDPLNTYQIKYTKKFTYFYGLFAQKKVDWETQVGNLSFNLYSYSSSAINFPEEVWQKSLVIPYSLIPSQSIPIWFRRTVPAGCLPIDLNEFEIEVKGEIL